MRFTGQGQRSLHTFSIMVSNPVRNVAAFDGRHGSMKPEGRRKFMGGA
jgi:hypothetical protein